MMPVQTIPLPAVADSIGDDLSVTISAPCATCRERTEGFNYDGFPGGIPTAILYSEHDHTQPYPGDGGRLYNSIRAAENRASKREVLMSSVPDVPPEEYEFYNLHGIPMRRRGRAALPELMQPDGIWITVNDPNRSWNEAVRVSEDEFGRLVKEWIGT